LRVVGSCFRSVVAILPVGSITSVGIRNFYIPGNPGSSDWPSALRLCAFSGFGSVNKTVASPVFPAVCRASAIVGISHSFALRLLFATSLQSEYHWELIVTRIRTSYLSNFAVWFSSASGFKSVLLPIHLFQSFCPSILRCACSSFPCGQSVQGVTCPLTLSCIPAFKSASANYSYEL
jgi:hypothetical protein